MWGKCNSVSLRGFFFIGYRTCFWHLQKCEATPDVECWRAKLSWRGSSDESLPQRSSWNRRAFWVCQHRTLSSVKPLTDRLCVEALSFLSEASSRATVRPKRLTPPGPARASIHPNTCTAAPCLDRGHAGVPILVLLPSRPSAPPHPHPIISQAVTSTTSSWVSWRLPFPSPSEV